MRGTFWHSLPASQSVRRLFAVSLAIYLLNALLVLGDFMETRWALLPAQVSLELVGVLALVTILSRWGGGSLRWILATVLLGLILLRLADIVVPWSFGRHFNAAVDLKYLPFFIGLLHGSLNSTLFISLSVGALIFLLAALSLLRWSIGVAAGAATAVRLRAFTIVALLAALAYTVTPSRYDLGPHPFGSAVAEAAWRNITYVWDSKGFSDRYLAQINAARAALPQTADLTALKGRNVLLVFVESYGAITFTDPTMGKALDPVRSRFEESVRAAGYQVHSSMLNSPITGGGSWMAHATMTAGVRIDSQPLYDVLLTTTTPTLGRFFRDHGYRTVAAMPRIQQPWPEGAFFSFDTILNDAAFAYAGMRFSWETIPDQFVLENVHAREIASADRPLFIQYVLSSSHLPFDSVPPLIDDGRTIGDGRIYSKMGFDEFPPPAGQVFDNKKGYVATIGYVLEALNNYLTKRLGDDSLIIIVGDHQPPLTIAAAARNKAVPIHVLSRDPALLVPFQKAGYAAGMMPPATTAEAGMESFLPWFLASYTSQPDVASILPDKPHGSPDDHGR
jgi:phosphoglycerol transferase MdoB-like AlkP superfamily enzyme